MTDPDVVYRNKLEAIPLGDAWRRGIAARFSRDSWGPELYHRPGWYRSSGPTQERKLPLLFHKKRNMPEPANDNAPPTRYAQDDMQAEHGVYVLAGFAPTKRGFLVLGRCTGKHCLGESVRKFPPCTWYAQREGMLGCSKCAKHNHLMRRRGRRVA